VGRWIFGFALVGFAVGVCAFVYVVRHEYLNNLLWNACFSCVNVTELSSYRLSQALLLVGPINAMLYGFIGLAVGKVLHSVRSR
jgi:hypothetical protein